MEAFELFQTGETFYLLWRLTSYRSVKFSYENKQNNQTKFSELSYLPIVVANWITKESDSV